MTSQIKSAFWGTPLRGSVPLRKRSRSTMATRSKCSGHACCQKTSDACAYHNGIASLKGAPVWWLCPHKRNGVPFLVYKLVFENLAKCSVFSRFLAGLEQEQPHQSSHVSGIWLLKYIKVKKVIWEIRAKPLTDVNRIIYVITRNMRWSSISCFSHPWIKG